MTDKQEKPQNVFNFDYTREAQTRPPQDYYDNIKNKYADDRDLRLDYRPPGTDGYTSDLTGDLAKYAVDPYGDEVAEREVIDDSVEVLFIGGGFSALLTSARLREKGVESIRIVEKDQLIGEIAVERAATALAIRAVEASAYELVVGDEGGTVLCYRISDGLQAEAWRVVGTARVTCVSCFDVTY